MPRRMAYDRIIFLTAGILVLAGVLMVGSASPYEALKNGSSPYTLVIKQVLHLVAGLIAMGAALSIPYRWLEDRRLVALLILSCMVALVIVLAMPASGGAHRWLRLGLLNVQPSEFAKLACVFFMASVLSRKQEQVNTFWAVPMPCAMIVGGMAFLIAIEPDLGSAVMLCVVAFVMIFTAGLNLRYVMGAGAVALGGIALAIVAEPYRMKRLMTYFRPESDVLGAGFQLNQSIIALGSGGLTGAGLGQGQQKAYFLPAPHTDFIYSVVGEEFGLLGTSLLLLAFLLLFWRGMRAAVRAPDRFGFYLALGLTTLIVAQGLINIGVCLGLLPTKGLPLPLVSYGGSSLVASLTAIGLLLNVSQYSN